MITGIYNLSKHRTGIDYCVQYLSPWAWLATIGHRNDLHLTRDPKTEREYNKPGIEKQILRTTKFSDFLFCDLECFISLKYF